MHDFRGSLRTLLMASIAMASTLSPAQATRSGNNAVTPSRWDVYGGYGYLHPINTSINNQKFNDIYNINMTLSVTRYLTPHWGAQAEIGYFSANSPRGAFGQCVGGACSSRDQSNYTIQGGPVYRFNVGRLVPFVHVLGGGSRTRGPFLQPLTWGYGVTAGGGVDYVLPYFHQLFSVRPIQADFQYSRVDYGPTPTPAAANYTGQLNMPAIKLSGGLVARFGNMEPVRPVAEACEVEPSVVFPGDPIKIDPATVNLNPRKKTTYVWTTTGGTLTLQGDGATLNTAGLAPGTYTVHGHLAQGGKQYQQADCSRDFTVRPYDPPTATCSATPASVRVGETANINAGGRSPQNRALTYSITTNGGQLRSQGANATLVAGTPGTVVATCTVTDDLGKSAVATASITVTAPVVPPSPLARTLCSVSFERDRKHPVRVDNEAKACLDEVALVMARESDAKLVLIGNFAPEENETAGAARTLNVRTYLTQDKGIDIARIEVYTGTGAGRSADSILLPPGATNPAVGAKRFNPASIQLNGEPYGRKKATTVRRKRRTK